MFYYYLLDIVSFLSILIKIKLRREACFNIMIFLKFFTFNNLILNWHDFKHLVGMNLDMKCLSTLIYFL